jgi:hypothetical protein
MIDPNTPSVPTLSPRSPLNLDADASKLRADNCTFAPEISKKAPRAWERKPATPFAPRTESHKIWKRCGQSLGHRGNAQYNKIDGQQEKERWRSVKRMRVGDARMGNEDLRREEKVGFLGTTFEGLEDVDAWRRRKPVTGVLCGESCIMTPLEEMRDRCGASSVDAGLDGNTSPRSAKRTGRKRRSGAGDANTVAKAGTQKVQEERQTQDTPNQPNASETQLVESSCREDSPYVKGVAKEVPQTSFISGGDDTEYLHAFVTRAKAKKAARMDLSPERQASNHQQSSISSSPQTRSRAALATLDANSGSPEKIRKVETQAKRIDQNNTVLSDVTPTSPLRKSSRTRLPRPQRHQSATPSTIPFRRSNGTEFVFLQKTEAQQIAIATRSNTRRNKGEAVQPKIKLEALSSQPQSSPAKVARKRTYHKHVAWDEGLLYFAPEEVQPTGEIQEQAEPKTPVKRSRRLAPGKGTPAPKKRMAEAALDVETPGSRTRTRTRGKT